MAPSLIPLFPLGTVLLPGAPLTLRVFEPRYRTLMSDLLDLPEPQRRFGVIAIREGHEVGEHAARALHEVGCLAQIRQVTDAPDGTSGVAAVGTARFRLIDVDRELPYLRGRVAWLPEQPGDIGDELVTAVNDRYIAYRTALGGTAAGAVDLPADPLLLSYLVAATVLADIGDRQQFLAAPDAAARLAAESSWLRRETVLLQQLSAAPGWPATDTPWSVN